MWRPFPSRPVQPLPPRGGVIPSTRSSPWRIPSRRLLRPPPSGAPGHRSRSFLPPPPRASRRSARTPLSTPNFVYFGRPFTCLFLYSVTYINVSHPFCLSSFPISGFRDSQCFWAESQLGLERLPFSLPRRFQWRLSQWGKAVCLDNSASSWAGRLLGRNGHIFKITPPRSRTGRVACSSGLGPEKF